MLTPNNDLQTNYCETDFLEENPILAIEIWLDEFLKNLEAYRSRPDAKQKFIEIEMAKYHRLKEAVQKLSDVKHFQLFYLIGRIINAFLEDKNYLEKFTVSIIRSGCSVDTPYHVSIERFYPF